MRIKLILFMILAVVASIGSRSPNTLLANLPIQVSTFCPHFVDRLKNFENCNAPLTLNTGHLADKLPYMCFLTINLLADICKENRDNLWTTFQTYYKAHLNKTICPFNYATNNRDVDVEVNKVAYYFRDKIKCEQLCEFSNQTSDDCIVMALLNELVIRLNGKGTEVNAALQKPQIQLEHDNSQVVSKQIGANPVEKSENTGDAVVETKSIPVKDQNETMTTHENKTAVKTEATSECEAKEKEEKISNVKVDRISKANITQNSKVIRTNSVISTINMTAVKNPKQDINTNGNVIVNNNDNNNNINKNNDNIPDSDNNNNISNEELEGKGGKKEVNTGKIDVLETGAPYFKGMDDQNLDSPSFGRKDYTYVATNKVVPDDGEDDDNNGDIPENAQLQDDVSDREYDSGRVPSPKELYNGDGLFQAEDSHFSAYFLVTISIIIIGYIIYHNKNKIVAYALEGRRGRNGRRRPTSASYRKLDCNLEEAIASNPSHASITNVVY